MKSELYYKIVDEISQFQGLTRDCADMLIHKYPTISSSTIHGIISSEVIFKVKRSMRKLYGPRQEYLQLYYTEKQNGAPPGIIVRIAASINLPPALLARVIFEEYYRKFEPKAEKREISKYLKDTTLIEDAHLAYEIYLCTLYDDRYGNISNSFASAIGHEYEIKLQHYLKERNIIYKTEDELKNYGYDKTPDIKLEVPIAVNGFIINWIESKARFGSPDIHHTHTKQQFLSYWNRFGPGLVIYWAGFVDEIAEQNKKQFIVLDHFPENIIYMNPTSIQH